MACNDEWMERASRICVACFHPAQRNADKINVEVRREAGWLTARVHIWGVAPRAIFNTPSTERAFIHSGLCSGILDRILKTRPESILYFKELCRLWYYHDYLPVSPQLFNYALDWALSPYSPEAMLPNTKLGRVLRGIRKLPAELRWMITEQLPFCAATRALICYGFTRPFLAPDVIYSMRSIHPFRQTQRPQGYRGHVAYLFNHREYVSSTPFHDVVRHMNYPPGFNLRPMPLPFDIPGAHITIALDHFGCLGVTFAHAALQRRAIRAPRYRQLIVGPHIQLRAKGPLVEDILPSSHISMRWPDDLDVSGHFRWNTPNPPRITLGDAYCHRGELGGSWSMNTHLISPSINGVSFGSSSHCLRWLYFHGASDEAHILATHEASDEFRDGKSYYWSYHPVWPGETFTQIYVVSDRTGGHMTIETSRGRILRSRPMAWVHTEAPQTVPLRKHHNTRITKLHVGRDQTKQCSRIVAAIDYVHDPSAGPLPNATSGGLASLGGHNHLPIAHGAARCGYMEGEVKMSTVLKFRCQYSSKPNRDKNKPHQDARFVQGMLFATVDGEVVVGRWIHPSLEKVYPYQLTTSPWYDASKGISVMNSDVCSRNIQREFERGVPMVSEREMDNDISRGVYVEPGRAPGWLFADKSCEIIWRDNLWWQFIAVKKGNQAQWYTKVKRVVGRTR